MSGRIVAMGGGGFSMEPSNPLLDRFVLDLAGRRMPRVCFVPTASGDSDLYIRRFYRAFRKFRCSPTHLSLFRPPPDPAGFLLRQDVIYVGGGNTRNLLLLWGAWGVDRAMRRAWRAGRVLAGVSAGALCWFEEGVTDSTGTLTPLRCLGFLRGSHCPHYDGERDRRPAYLRLVADGLLRPGLAADDGAALHFEGGRLVGAVSSRRKARAWRVERVRGHAVESMIVPEYLG